MRFCFASNINRTSYFLLGIQAKSSALAEVRPNPCWRVKARGRNPPEWPGYIFTSQKKKDQEKQPGSARILSICASNAYSETGMYFVCIVPDSWAHNCVTYLWHIYLAGSQILYAGYNCRLICHCHTAYSFPRMYVNEWDMKYKNSKVSTLG